jgi:poly-gamma-glutamate synthesis protein (capsule biosynthesis protein)
LRLATERIAAHDTAAQIVVASLHWGDNWGYGVSAQEREFAHGLIDEAGVDVVHGHSSHHPKGIEVYRRRVILYGCGDLLNDYEGIGGYESYRAELGLMYFLTLDATSGELRRLSMTPTRMQRLRVSRAAAADAAWLQASLDRECRALGSAGVVGETDSSLTLRPAQT